MKEDYNEKNFNDEIDKIFKDLHDKINSTLNILVIGKVSSGKSSFLNAFFDAEKDKPIFEVGAQAGVTKDVKFKNIGKTIKICDTPGLDDVIKVNSEETLKMLEEGVDIGILIISGAADSSQKKHFDDLKKRAAKVFIVLNKRDEFTKENLAIVLNQWSGHLALSKDETIYTVVSKGYDPKDRLINELTDEETEIPVDKYKRPVTLKGIDTVRDDVLKFLEKSGKDILLAKELKNKTKSAIAIIATACLTATGAAFLPGSAAIIGTIQVGAIASLGYLYTGELISKSQALSAVGVVVANSVGRTLFLVVKSFMPPTGVLDLAAATIALTVTAAMLTAVAKLLERGYTLDDKEQLKKIFDELMTASKELFKNANLSDLKDKSFFIKILTQLFSAGK
ncbi:hypothetical protein GCM10028803_00860 [Larkinella knui]|uniref:GTP-binding protein n=1 Tax=Larkinella knui TaxID=2025310 RepID=A0A3P1CMA4_9BACT|nr:GTPase [Larkinella knui]RRB14206.1 GTP-binding protein [Larkinella knui]